MGRHNLLNGYWTDFDGLLKAYQEDLGIAKNLDNTVTEIEFINIHVLPQFEDFLKKEDFFPAKLAWKRMVDYLKKRVAELLQLEQEITTLSENKLLTSSFDYSNLNTLFFNDKIEGFKLIESEMIQKEFIVNDKWHNKKPKKSLVALIYILKELKYLRPKFENKSVKTSLLAYRRFFEQRYKTNISKEMQPSKFEVGKLKDYKPEYFFIPKIDEL